MNTPHETLQGSALPIEADPLPARDDPQALITRLTSGRQAIAAITHKLQILEAEAKFLRTLRDSLQRDMDLVGQALRYQQGQVTICPPTRSPKTTRYRVVTPTKKPSTTSITATLNSLSDEEFTAVMSRLQARLEKVSA